MDEDFDSFVQKLSVAASEIDNLYFQLPVAEADAVYRERVYCYELYHQLRSVWEDLPYALSGEVDKVGHPLFRNGPYERSKPAFLVLFQATWTTTLRSWR